MFATRVEGFSVTTNAIVYLALVFGYMVKWWFVAEHEAVVSRRTRIPALLSFTVGRCLGVATRLLTAL